MSKINSDVLSSVLQNTIGNSHFKNDVNEIGYYNPIVLLEDMKNGTRIPAIEVAISFLEQRKVNVADYGIFDIWDNRVNGVDKTIETYRIIFGRQNDRECELLYVDYNVERNKVIRFKRDYDSYLYK